MFRKHAMRPALALILAALVLGPGLVWNHLRALRSQAVQGFEENLTDDDLEAHLRVQIGDLERQLQEYRVKTGKVAERAATLEVSIHDREKQLTTRKQRLRHIQQLLEQRQGSYVIAGRSYTLPEVEEEGKSLLDGCRQLEQRLSGDRELAGKLRQALGQSKTHLAEAQRMKQQVLAEIETTRARLTNARLRKELGDLNDGLREAPLGPSSDLSRQLAAFRDRARNSELQADALLAEPHNNGIVDWDAAGSAADVRTSIQHYLQGNTATTPAR